MLKDSHRSRVITCHSRDIGNVLLDYHHLENIKMVERKIVIGQGYGWVLVGVRGCVAVDMGHSLVTLLSLSGRLRTDRCIRF